MSKSSQESSPITQYKTMLFYLLAKYDSGGYSEPDHDGYDEDRQIDRYIDEITSATIELIEGLIPQEDTRLFPGWPLGDPVRETCYKQGRNEAITELRQSLKEMNHDIER